MQRFECNRAVEVDGLLVVSDLIVFSAHFSPAISINSLGASGSVDKGGMMNAFS